MNKTLNEVLKENGYTSEKSKFISGKKDLYKDGVFIGTFAAFQVWEMLRFEGIEC